MPSPDASTLPHFDTRKLDHWLAFGFGAGLSPWAPGTVGTLVAVPIYLLLSMLPLALYLIILALLIVVGIRACGRTARDIGGGDPPAIVGDEILGFLVTMIAAPAGIIWVVAGFLLFRAFDILKPWPVGLLQRRLKGGLGIVADDLAAGALAWVVLSGMAMLVESSLRGVHAVH